MCSAHLSEGRSPGFYILRWPSIPGNKVSVFRVAHDYVCRYGIERRNITYHLISLIRFLTNTVIRLDGGSTSTNDNKDMSGRRGKRCVIACAGVYRHPEFYPQATKGGGRGYLPVRCVLRLQSIPIISESPITRRRTAESSLSGAPRHCPSHGAVLPYSRRARNQGTCQGVLPEDP